MSPQDLLPVQVEKRHPATGPLRVSDANPRYLSDGNGQVVYLTGSHTWCNFIDCGDTNPPVVFDYDEYLKFLEEHNHNFIRLWRAENARGGELGPDFWFSPMPYERSNVCCAFDGGNKFDLTKFNQAYFDRLRQRVIQAGERGIYVSIMLFDGWSVESQIPNHKPWPGHPFNTNNNINGIDGDLNENGQGEETHTLESPEITALQEAYVRKVIDTVNDLDNVLYEISNESEAEEKTQPWQFYMVNFVKGYEAKKAKRHPVGLTSQLYCYQNSDLYTSPADWISPCFEMKDPITGTGEKVILPDTDHLYGDENRQWVWKSFLRGLNPIMMDPYDKSEFGRGAPLDYDPDNYNDVSIRNNMGYARSYAERINLTAMHPLSDTCSTHYCLANPVQDGAEYLIYLPIGSTISNLFKAIGMEKNPLIYLPTDEIVMVDLSASLGEMKVEWLNPANGAIMDGGVVAGGKTRTFISPFRGDAVLYIHSNQP